MSDLILHHYDSSPFSEKVRLAFGIKGLAWSSVQTPNMLPKPGLLPLTGGYRRAPVMQVGADVYCDSQCILRELERRHPEPSLYRDSPGGLVWALGFWADRVLFQASVALVFGTLAEAVPEAFVRDREALTGRKFDPVAMRAAIPAARDQVRAHAQWIATELKDGRDFIDGYDPGLTDIHAYFCFWFVSQVHKPYRSLSERFPRFASWEARMDAHSRGERTEMDAERALAIAREAEPATEEQTDEEDPDGLVPGDAVRVAADDYGQDPVAGVLVASSPQEIAIRRSAPEVGDVVVHFPRAGFAVSRA